MEFIKFAGYLERLEKTSSRLEITRVLAELFQKSNKEEVEEIVNLSLGQLAPAFKNVVFNLAERMMVKVLAKAYQREETEALRYYKEKGDLGDVAQSLATKASSRISVSEVYRKLYKIAVDEGTGSQERKIQASAELLSFLDPLSARFVARIPVGRLRLGFSDKTVLDALSFLTKGDKSAKEILEKAYQVRPDVGLLAREVKEKGVERASKSQKPEVGIPVLPMLAQRLKSPREMVEKMVEVAVEPKLDGLRVQIHLKGKEVKAFTRNLNETSWMFPELKEAAKSISAKEAILDTEAVGVDEARQKLANFQTTMTRRRKHEIEKTASKVPIFFYVFDILSKDKKSLMEETYRKRRSVLEKTVTEGKLFKLVSFELTKDPKRITDLNQQEKKRGREGIMVKRADSAYVPGRTGWRWVKMKEAEMKLAKLADTIDCLVMGYSRGRGKRAQFHLGQFLVGVKDKEKIKTVSKIGTGLTDTQFRELGKRLKKITVSQKPKEYEVRKTLEPDFWVKSALVVEIAADEITKSPTHSAGLALRFPRLVKMRDDKSPGQATTLSEVKKLFKLQ